jgi:hypothetical protein
MIKKNKVFLNFLEEVGVYLMLIQLFLSDKATVWGLNRTNFCSFFAGKHPKLPFF